MNKKPLISVIIVNYNGAEVIEDTLSSISGLDYPSDRLEMIVVDNGSKDNSLTLIESKYPEVIILSNDVNNYCKANNIGIKKASGEYVLLLNNDVAIASNWLNEILPLLNAEEKIIGGSGKILFSDGRIQSTGHYFLPNFYWGDRGFKENDRGQYDRVEEMESLANTCTLYKKWAFERVGFFDEDFHMYLEDVDFCYRCRKKGYKILYVPRAICWHRFHGSAEAEFVKEQVEKNRLLFIAKHFPEKLSENLLGFGLSTLEESRTDSIKIAEYLPLVVRKLISTHKWKTVNGVLPSILERIREVVNYEKYYLAQQNCELEKELERFRQEIFQKENDLKNLNEEVSFKNEELLKLRRELNELNQELKTCMEELESIRREGELKKEQIEAKEKEFQELRIEISVLREVVDKERERRECLSQEIGRLQKEIQGKEAQIQSKDEELEEKRKELEIKRDELKRQVEQIEAKEEESLKLKAELSALKEMAEKEMEEIQKLSQEIGQLQENVEKKAEEIKERDKKLVEKEEIISYLGSELEKKGRELKEEKKQLSDALERIGRQEADIENLKREIENLKRKQEAFYSSQTFRFVVKPLWKILDFIKEISGFGIPKVGVVKPYAVTLEEINQFIYNLRQEEKCKVFAIISTSKSEKSDYLKIWAEKKVIFLRDKKLAIFLPIFTFLLLALTNRFKKVYVLESYQIKKGYRKARFLASLLSTPEVKIYYLYKNKEELQPNLAMLVLKFILSRIALYLIVIFFFLILRPWAKIKKTVSRR